MTVQLAHQRKVFTTNRTLEYFSEKELRAQTGVDSELLPIALLRELIDNALDACESESHTPEIVIECGRSSISVQDNGPGIPKPVVRSALDYETRTSSNTGYVGPTRGQQGNALKTIFAAPFVCCGEDAAPVVVKTHEFGLGISVEIDRIEQTPVFTVSDEAPLSQKGTFVKFSLPQIATYLDESRSRFGRTKTIAEMVKLASVANPHASFDLIINDELVYSNRVDGEFNKFPSSGKTAIEWYSEQDFDELYFAVLKHDRDNNQTTTARQFVGQFYSMARKSKSFHGLLSEWDPRELKQQIYNSAKRMNPKILGKIGKETMLNHACEQFGGEGGYCTKTEVVGEVPFIVEVAVAFNKDHEDWGQCGLSNQECILNWSPQFLSSIPEYLSEYLFDNKVEDVDPVSIVFSIISPKIPFTDRGKSKLCLPVEVEDAIEKMLCRLLSPWKRIKRRLERSLKKIHREPKVKKLSIKEACFGVMKEAYEHAAGKQAGANARQIMYAARKLALNKHGLFCKNDSTFTQDYLPEYIRLFSPDWNVFYDARGHLVEPHTSREIKVGTREVREYVRSWTGRESRNTIGPINRYGGILFIEKEGFDSHILEAGIREEFDIATVSTKGQSSTASREILDELSKLKIPIFVLHDFDKYGIEIRNTLENDNDRYQYRNRPNIIDIGLRLEDIREYGLEGEPTVYGKPNPSRKSQPKDPSVSLKRCGAADREIDFLVQGYDEFQKVYFGRRVELNELSTDQILSLICQKIGQHARKVVPANDVLESHYLSGVRSNRTKTRLEEIRREIEKEESLRQITVPDNLHQIIDEGVRGTKLSWSHALQSIVDKHDEKRPA